MNTTKVGKYTIAYNNSKEFHTLKSEIFGEECYNIELDKENPYILDIGAYIGISTVYFKSIYPNSHILAVEPNPKARELLEENIFLNNLENIQILPYAIDISEGEREMFYDNSNLNWQSTAGFKKNSWNGEYVNNDSIQVKTIPLSKLLDKEVDLLKLDIEGMEGKVLKEASKSLKNVKNIIVEYHPMKGNDLNKISSTLKNNGFQISFFEDGKEVSIPDAKKLQIIKATRQ
jgi:FkbM family methyltransferase